jgi:small-conductance mechanosensitive channel
LFNAGVMMNFLFEKTYLGNTLAEYSIAVLLLLITFLIIHLLKKFIIKRLQKNVDESRYPRLKLLVKGINRRLIPIIYLGAVFLALEFLSFGSKADKIIGSVYMITATWFAVRFIISILEYTLGNYLAKSRGEEEGKKLKPLLSFLNFLVWIIGALLLLDNLGFNISTLIAGLGITGIAVALAAQALLGDLFSYFVIFFDKPFEIGDYVVFENNSGNIEKIGIKTTRIRSLSGEQLIVSNSKLTNTTLHNFKRMEKRRIAFTIGVTHQTNPEQLNNIPQLVKEIILKNELVEFDRGHFKSFEDSSLCFEFVYYILSPDYSVYMNIQQKINFDIYEEFNKRGTVFAYPTQTIYVNKEN